MDRRQFLIRAGVLTGQFVVARFFDRALAFVENHNEPLLEVPRDVSRELFVVEEHFDYKLYLGKPDTFIPDPPTWRELFLLFGDSVKIDLEDFELEPHQLGETVCPHYWQDYWCLAESSNAKAFDYLWGLDLGPVFDPNAKSDVAGEIRFPECPAMCSTYRGVETDDLLSISLLQNRLNELGESTRVAMLEP